ncbi:MAG: hypothetical protein IKT03_06860 [Muribaculaceae bacterium]|nr:hypothetical protein [Muribaculaceae bacterium]MBR6490238.1 hypothetical protein [Muribaculaceae bacterium]
MKKETRLQVGNVLLCIAMTILLIAAIIPFFSHDWQGWKYLFAAGALGTLVAQILIPAPSQELRVKRLSHINVASAVAYCVAAYCPFSHDFHMQRSWVAFLLAGAVLQLYATFMQSRLMSKKKDDSQSEKC